VAGLPLLLTTLGTWFGPHPGPALESGFPIFMADVGITRSPSPQPPVNHGLAFEGSQRSRAETSRDDPQRRDKGTTRTWIDLAILPWLVPRQKRSASEAL